MENHPDLPQLENVSASLISVPWESRIYANRFFGLAAAALAIMDHLLRFLHDLHFLKHHNRIFLIGSACALAGFVIDHIFVKVHKWRTDERGLTARKLLWSTFVRWSDVREVKVKLSSLNKLPAGYRLITRDGSMWVPVPTMMLRDYALLLGSIRQHLKRFGKADEIVLPEELEDLWWQVPDSVPTEVSWADHSSPTWHSLRALLIVKAVLMVLAAGLGVWLLGWEAVRTTIYLCTFLLGGVWAFLWYWLHKERTVAVRVQVSDDGIEAETGFGHAFLRWQDIRAAGWGSSDTALKLSGRRATLRIRNHNGAGDLILAALRNLRAMPKFECIAIPKDLRRTPHVVA